MKFRILKKDLVDDLAAASSIADHKANFPILSSVLLSARKDSVRLVSTDLNHTLIAVCDADVDLRSETAVPVKKLLEIVRALPCEEILIESGGTRGTLTISGGHSRFTIHTRPADEFPTMPDLGAGAGVAVPADAIRRLVAGVIYAVGGEESRFQIKGALFVFKEGAIEAAATDGHRLALVEQLVPGLAPDLDGSSFLIARRALQELPRFSADAIQITVGENHIGFKAGNRELITRKLEGTFPDYNRVIAKTNDKKPVFARESLIEAVRRVGLMTGERQRVIRVDLIPDQAKLSAANFDLGEAEEEVTCTYDGGIVRLGVNPRYLIEALESMSTASVRIEVKDSDSQMVIYAEGEAAPEDRQALSVLMPMRV